MTYRRQIICFNDKYYLELCLPRPYTPLKLEAVLVDAFLHAYLEICTIVTEKPFTELYLLVKLLQQCRGSKSIRDIVAMRYKPILQSEIHDRYITNKNIFTFFRIPWTTPDKVTIHLLRYATNEDM